jgi:flagellin-like protein
MFVKRGKRGISPLIATVLLIAFAVAIGTMVMNIGRNVNANVGDCNDVKLEVQTINGKPLLCYDTLNNKMNFLLKNTGSVDIQMLKFYVTASDFSHEEKDLVESSIKQGDTLSKNFDYVKSGTFKVELVPVISFAGKDRVCLQQAAVTESIDRCN